MAAAPVPASLSRPALNIRRTLYAIGFAVWASGVLYWTFDKYMLRRSDIGLSENPLQVWWLRLHAGTATAAVWLFGYMCAIHVQRNWTGGLRRNSGSLFVSTLAFLTITGYLIYYVEADRPAAMITQWHWVVGLFAPLAFLLHRGMRRRPSAAHAGPRESPLSPRQGPSSRPPHPPCPPRRRRRRPVSSTERPRLLSRNLWPLAWPLAWAVLGGFGLSAGASAEEVHALAGVSDRSDPPSTTYGWQLAFDKSIDQRFAASLSWVNEGHFAGHQRDGAAAQLWLSGPRWGRRGVGLDLGIGPYLFFDTQPAATARGFSDVHGLGGMLSAALSMPLGRAWLLDLRANEILTRDELSTFTLLAGVGYRFSLAGLEDGTPGAETLPARTEPPVLELLGGETITNSLSTRQAAAFGVDYRLPIVRWAAASASWFDDTEAPRGLHQRLAAEGWLMDGPLGRRLTLSVGVGPYVLLGPLPAGRSGSARLSGLSALRADWRLAPHLALILTWYRTFTNDDLDRDLISLGLGWRFETQ